MSLELPLAEVLNVRSACARLSALSRKFEFGNLEFKVKGLTAKYPLEAVFMEELLISLALAETYLKGLIHLNTLGFAKVNRFIGVLEMALGESPNLLMKKLRNHDECDSR